MQWTMPHRVLQIVAGLIGLAAVSSFALGIVTAPNRQARLPGAKTAGAAGPAAAIQAADATPLSDERIEGPPPPTPEEIAKAKAEADAKKAEQAAAKARAEEEAELEPTGNALPPLASRPAPAGNSTPTPPSNGAAAPEDPIF